MSLFSKSKSKGHYPNQNYGSDYYKRPNKTGGFLGKILGALTGSGNNSRSYSNKDHGHYPKRNNRKSSWS